MIRVLVTGGNGQLGSEFKAIAPDYPYFSLTFTDLPELDLAEETDTEAFLEAYNFDVVINCAAYTAVDKAEEDPVSAMKANRDAVANLARACDHTGCYLVHISTDYVFDGKGDRPYKEQDTANPQTVYGHSKLAGEEAMMTCLSQGMIIRTSWLYSSFGNNFVKTILKKAKEKGSLKVVADQFGNPTYARDLARTILDILPHSLSVHELQILHYSNEGICSWHEFADAIVEMAGIHCKILPVTTSEYPLLTPRPAYSALDKSLIKKNFNIHIPEWKDSLRDCIGLMQVRK